MQPYSSTDTAKTWKKSRYILSEIPDAHLIDNLSISVHAFPMPILTSFSVDYIYIYIFWYTGINRYPDYKWLPVKAIKFLHYVPNKITEQWSFKIFQENLVLEQLTNKLNSLILSWWIITELVTAIHNDLLINWWINRFWYKYLKSIFFVFVWQYQLWNKAVNLTHLVKIELNNNTFKKSLQTRLPLRVFII